MFTEYESASNSVENLSVVLEMFRGELERAGCSGEAANIRGLEITGPASLQVAINAVCRIPAKGEMVHVRTLTINAIRACQRTYS